MTEVAATATAPPAAAAPHLTCDVVEATSASITTTSHPRARKPPPFAAHPPAATMSPGMTLFSVQAVLILSTEDGSRIFAKYYSPPHSTASAAGTFEAHPPPPSHPSLVDYDDDGRPTTPRLPIASHARANNRIAGIAGRNLQIVRVLTQTASTQAARAPRPTPTRTSRRKRPLKRASSTRRPSRRATSSSTTTGSYSTSSSRTS